MAAGGDPSVRSEALRRRPLAIRLLLLLGKVAAGAVLVLLAAEASFRIAGALTAEDRGDAGLADEHLVALCVGDSHTWGLGKGYPARLAARLAARSDRYRVVNLGVPGTNTAQLRRRFIGYLDRFRPRAVVFWGGINNAWNLTDTDLWEGDGSAAGQEHAPRSWLERLLERSRMVRLYRVWRREAELNRVLASGDPYVVPKSEPGKNIWFDHRRTLAGDEDVFQNRGGGKQPVEELERVTSADVRWMIDETARRGIPMVVVAYAIGEPSVMAVNRGIRAGVAGTDGMLVESADALRRIGERYDARHEPRPQLFDKTAHPTQEQYDVIGDLVLERFDERGALPADVGDGVRRDGETITILPLGDSITEKWGKVSYRYWLWQGLREAGWRNVDFIGTQKDPWATDFDPDHEGHGAWSAQELLHGRADRPGEGNVETWLAGAAPDVALIVAGTNDVMRRSCALQQRACTPDEQETEFRRGAAAAIEALRGMIEALRRRNPHVAIVLGQIPPSIWMPSSEVRRFNDQGIAALARELSTPTSLVVTVDLQEGNVADPKAPDSDTTDGIHPNFSGARKIAARFQEALTARVLPWVVAQRRDGP